MEKLLHYCWKHRLTEAGRLFTTDGQLLEVFDVGLHNKNAGPDFFNVKLKIGGTLWAGNVEIHEKSSDWYVHGHEKDANYDSVVLHVAETINSDVRTSKGCLVPQFQLSVPPYVLSHYEELLATDDFPRCHQIIPGLSPLMLHSWMSALQAERLQQKTAAIGRRMQQSVSDWDATYFVTLARNFGFGINTDAFEAWANSFSLLDVIKHRDDPFQVEAIFMGQAGLLTPESIPERHREQALKDDYYIKLRDEYSYLQHKFNLTPIDHKRWRFLRLRPHNFPQIRISQLVNLFCCRQLGFSQLLECGELGQVRSLLSTKATAYWENHYGFGNTSRRHQKLLSEASLQVLIINTVVPMLFAYGQYIGDEQLIDRSFSFLEQLPAERNSIIDMWRQCGIDVKSAGDTQALIQLKSQYCDRKDCLRCRIGFEYLKKRDD